MTHAIVVDDNEELAANLAELLESLDVTVDTAHDAASAVALAERHDLSLAVVDVRLPGGASGVDLVPRLRAAAPNIEIIIVTGNATVDSAVAAVRHGIFAYVQKPFDSRDLLAIARRALDQARVRTEREHLALDLARSEAMYRDLVDTIDTAIVLLDASGHIRFVNSSARALAPEGSDLEGKDFAAIFATDDLDSRVRAALTPRSHQDDPRRPRSVEARIEHATGARVVRWTFTPQSAREPGQWLVVGIDLTEVRELQQRTVEAEALATVGALTTGLAHEIRNPLNAASLQLELLVRSARKVEEPKLRDSMVDRVRIVRDELGRLERMLRDFLSLARPRGLDLASVNLGSLLADVVELQTPVAELQGAVLVHIPSELPIRVQVDTARIKQVLINLISNALDALRGTHGGRVELEAKVISPGWIEVRVSDDGPGLDSGSDEVFKPFVTTKEGGTGLGLSIVRTIVSRHGGEVSIVPNHPSGAVASFTVHGGVDA